MKVLSIFLAVLVLAGCARTTASYDSPEFGSIKYSSTKNVLVVKEVVRPDGTREYIKLVGDAASVERARGEAISGYLSGAEGIALTAAQMYLQQGVKPVPAPQSTPAPVDFTDFDE
ncbi:MAG: hypothetical protein E6R03_06990 [Hyphomicrobiaceae bacterium]|nr:MAG: hypothetical protein E6R03_06990 [Hyphomicrobiaceae bacterium]